MRESTGNFLTLSSAIEKFAVDATRIALADGSDGIDDANFEETTANATILKPFELKKWITGVVRHPRLLDPEQAFEQVRTAEKPGNSDAIQSSGPLALWD